MIMWPEKVTIDCFDLERLERTVGLQDVSICLDHSGPSKNILDVWSDRITSYTEYWCCTTNEMRRQSFTEVDMIAVDAHCTN
jgi:hypothetical protein